MIEGFKVLFFMGSGVKLLPCLDKGGLSCFEVDPPYGEDISFSVVVVTLLAPLLFGLNSEFVVIGCLTISSGVIECSNILPVGS